MVCQIFDFALPGNRHLEAMPFFAASSVMRPIPHGPARAVRSSAALFHHRLVRGCAQLQGLPRRPRDAPGPGVCEGLCAALRRARSPVRPARCVRVEALVRRGEGGGPGRDGGAEGAEQRGRPDRASAGPRKAEGRGREDQVAASARCSLRGRR